MKKTKFMLACEVCKTKNYKISKTFNKRFIIKKYCKVCQKHQVHKEEK